MIKKVRLNLEQWIWFSKLKGIKSSKYDNIIYPNAALREHESYIYISLNPAFYISSEPFGSDFNKYLSYFSSIKLHLSSSSFDYFLKY